MPFEFAVMSVDPSGAGKDETAYAVIKACRGMLYLVDSGGLAGGYSENVMNELAAIAKEWAVNNVIENNFGQGMFTTLFRPYLLKVHTAELEERQVRTKKEERIIDTLEPVLSQHRLVVTPDVVQRDFQQAEQGDTFKSLFFQLSRLQRADGALPFDDRLDALEAAVWKCQQMLGVDPTIQNELAEEERARKVAEASIEKCRKAGTLGRVMGDGGPEGCPEDDTWPPEALLNGSYQGGLSDNRVGRSSGVAL